MTPELERIKTELLKRYPSRKWKDKVNKMNEAQLIAIYLRMRKSGEIR